MPVGKGCKKRCFCPSVCLSVAYIANNLMTQRPSMPKFGRKFTTLDATVVPVSMSNSQRSRSPGPLMLTHIVCHIFRMLMPTNFKIVTWMEDDDPHQPQAPGPPRSQGLVISLSRLGPAVPVSLEAGGGILCRPNPSATFLVISTTLEMMKIFVLFYMCHFATGLTHCYRTAVYQCCHLVIYSAFSSNVRRII